MAVDRTAEVAASIAAGTVVVTAPVLGDYAVIVLFAIFGAFVNVSRQLVPGDSPKLAIFAMARGVLISATFTWLASLWFSGRMSMPLALLLAPVAFAIAFIGDDWFRLKDLAIERIAALARRDRA